MANLTIKVDDDLLQRARRKALAQGKSVEALLRRHLEQFASVDDQRQAGIDDLHALARASRAESGGRRWTRDELYDRR
jgi:predicted transcriptional regulator